MQGLIDEFLAKSSLASYMQAENRKDGKNKKRIATVTLNPNYALYKNSDLIWAKSGTTTLEITLYGRPMIIFFKANFFSYLLFLLFKTVKNVGWPNLLSGKTLVPELIQLDCRQDQFVKYTLDLFEVPGLRREVEAELLSLKELLGQGDYVDNCTEELLKLTKASGYLAQS